LLGLCLRLLNTVANQIAGKCLCALGEFSVMAVTTGIKHFREDFESSVQAPESENPPDRALSPAAEATRAEVGR
jgi:hypothetical protein